MFWRLRFRAFDAGPLRRWLCSAINQRHQRSSSTCAVARMPKLAKQATQTHYWTLRFSPPSLGLDDPLAWETDAESDTGEDNSEQWEQQPRPITYEERLSKLAVRREKAAEKWQVAEVRSAEMQLGGQMDSQKGKKRGPYNVGGFSKRTIQEKSMKL
ncbi:hypothetical protein B0H10DRAFT_1956744 [Mycena sp. CBHHK59/15]|nr:hypothetical protein B0H10DRAFT_1956744 [Mycena sp. CBHHK59/15]